MKEQFIRYRPGLDPKPEDKTDWERVRNMTDEQLARAFRPGGLIALRQRLGLDQAEFAHRFWIDLDTLKSLEQGMGAPDDIARAYLRVIERNPDAVAAALEER